MTDAELIKALRRLKVETGSLACLGCGHEHACSTRGCAILRAAEDRIDRDRWISIEERLPEPWVDVLTYFTFGREMQVDCADEWGRFQIFATTHWMPLPEPPKEEP